MRGEKEKIKQAMGFKTEKEFNEYINKITQTNSVVSRHYFADSQYSFPTPELYAKLQTTGFFRREYEDLRREYEDLRREYEDLRRVWNNNVNAKDVLSFPIISGKTIHPTQKPDAIIHYVLERSSKENDLVLDCFSGSGTTAVACHNLNRRFICIEKDPDYWAASVERLNREKTQMRLF
jgi:site-specific DNA-methyltransferase (adenine-specific)